MARRSPAARSTSSTRRSTAGRSSPRRRSPILPDDDAEALHARDPRGRAPAAAARRRPAARRGGLGGRRRPSRARRPRDGRRRASRRRAARCCRSRTRPVSSTSGAGWSPAGFELVSTGGTARTLRDAGLPVTDVAARDRLPGDARRAGQDAAPARPRGSPGRPAPARTIAGSSSAPAIAPFELVVVNLYPFAAALERPGITVDELIEEIDIGGPSMVRAAAKNHANVAIVTSPARYDGGPGRARRSRGPRRRAAPRAGARGLRPHGRLRRADRRRAAGPVRGGRPGPPGRARSAGAGRSVSADADARAREGRDAPLRREPAPAGRPLPAPGHRPPRTACSASERPPLQGKALSYNNVLDAAAAAALGRALRGPGVVIVKHTNPCGAAERPTPRRGVVGGARGGPGQRLRWRGRADATGRPRSSPRRSSSIFLEIVVAPAFDADALEVLARKPNLRVLVDEGLADDGAVPALPRRPGRSVRPAAPSSSGPRTRWATIPTTWTSVTRRAPSDDELLDLDLAWRLVRGVTSNAIVLVKDRRLVGMGSGQTSRVDAARQAVAKAHAMLGDGVDARRVLRVRRVLPVPRRRRGLPRGRRHGVRAAGRLGARCGRCRGRRRRRRGDARDGRPALPPLTR